MGEVQLTSFDVIAIQDNDKYPNVLINVFCIFTQRTNQVAQKSPHFNLTDMIGDKHTCHKSLWFLC